MTSGLHGAIEISSARSPKLKLNFSRFGGILIGVYNAAVKNKHLGEVHTTGSVLESGRDHTEKQ